MKDVHSFAPPSSPDKLLAWAEHRLDTAARLDEFTAKQNLAFLLGQQWGVWDGERRRFATDRVTTGPNAPVRVTVNKIGGLVERVVSKLTKDLPIPECRPVTDTQTDVNAAKVGTRILSHEHQRLELDSLIRELYFWVAPLGWSFLHLRWDPTDGPVVGVDEDGDELHLGNIMAEEVPAFEIRIDPNARRWRNARWCIRTVAMTREAVFDQYGVEVTDSAHAEHMAQEWKLSSPTSGTGKSRPRTEGVDESDFVSVHQFWMKPGGRAKPEGCVFTWCGKQVLEKPAPFPYEHGRLPFEPLNFLPALGGDPSGRTWVTDLVPLQKDYNDARSREAMIRRTLAPKVLAARGQIDPHRLTSRVEVIDYNPTGPTPSLMLPDGRWMQQFEQAMNRVDAEMGDRAGQQDVSQGRAASSAPAASILALQEADETKMAISSAELGQFVQNLGYQILMLARQFWDEARTVRTWSRDGALEVDQFSGADIGQQLDVHVSAESSMPRSKSARTQLAIDLWTQGIVSDPRHFVRMLDLPGTDFLIETLNVDAKQAEREHGYLVRGEPVEVRVWENHAAHIAKHDEYRKSEEYEHLEPQLQAHFDGHVQAHYEIVAQQAAAAAQAAAAPTGDATQNPTGANGEGIDPATGVPQDPLAVAGGLSPTGASGPEAAAAQGPIGGTGNAGPVPGVTPDTQMYRTGN